MTKVSKFMTKSFNNVKYTIYTSKNDNTEFWMERKQIGQALGYTHPNSAIQYIHAAHVNCLNDNSKDVYFRTEKKGSYHSVVYNYEGIRELCYHSRKSNAKKFIEWIKEVKQEVHDKSTISFKEMDRIINSRLNISLSYDDFVNYLKRAYYIKSGNPTCRSMDLGIMGYREKTFYKPYFGTFTRIVDRGFTRKGQKYFLDLFKKKLEKQSV